jgi:hypothetical protein
VGIATPPSQFLEESKDVLKQNVEKNEDNSI